jgi:PilZ domain
VSHPEERRTSPRCDAVNNRSSIEFATPQGLRRIEARLVNISRDGAFVAASTQPPEATPISLRIESPVRTDWVDATIVRVDPNRLIGVHFARGCPYDLLLAGTVGIDLASMIRNGPNLTTACD